MSFQSDQATQLRQLARIASRGGEAATFAVRGPHRPSSVLVAGGKTRAGVTTIAGQLALAAARDGRRVVLGDLDNQAGDVCPRMGVASNYDLDDILLGHKGLLESLIAAQLGIQLIPGSVGKIGQASALAIDRVVAEFPALDRQADMIILDAGSEIESLQRVFWDRADEVLMVSTPDSLSVLDAYATLKANRAMDLRRVGLIVNRARNEDQARDVFARLSHSCRRFLKTDIAWRGWLPYSTALTTRPGEPQPAPHPNHALSAVFESLLANYRKAADPESNTKVRQAA